MGEGDVGFAHHCAVLIHKAGEAALQVDIETTGRVAAEDDAPHGAWWHYPEEILRQEHDAPRAAHVPAALEPDPLVLVATRNGIVEYFAGHAVGGIGRAAATGVVLAERLEGYPERLPPGRELDPPTQFALAPGVIGAALPALLVHVEDTGALRQMGLHQVPGKLPRSRPRQVGRPVLGHLPIRDLLEYLAQLVRFLDGLAGRSGVDALLVQLVRAEHLYIHLHLGKRLLERHEKVLGVGDVAALGVRYVREAVADVVLVSIGDARGYLAQRVDRVRVEDETDLLATLPKGVRHRLGDEDLAQVASVDVTGDADAADDYVRPRAKRFGDPLGPAGYVNAGRAAGLAHAVLHNRSVVREEAGRAPGVLAGHLDVDDLVLRRTAGGGDRNLLPHLPLEHGPAHRGGVAELPARRVRLVGADDLERPLLSLPDDPEGHRGAQIDRVFLDFRRVDDLHVARPALELADPAFQQALLVLRLVVLGVLGDVPELAGLADAVGDLFATRLGQVCEFLLELLQTLRCNELLVLIGHKPRDYKVV